MIVAFTFTSLFISQAYATHPGIIGQMKDWHKNKSKYKKNAPAPKLSKNIKQLQAIMAGKWSVSGSDISNQKLYSGYVSVKPKAKGQFWVINYKANIVSIKNHKILRQRDAFMVMTFPSKNTYTINSYQDNGSMKTYHGHVKMKDGVYTLGSDPFKVGPVKMSIHFTVNPIDKNHYLQKFYITTNNKNSADLNKTQPLANLSYTRIHKYHHKKPH